VTISKAFGVSVHLFVLQAKESLDILDLGVLRDLVDCRVADVQQLAP
jgi:hypothetical protein